MTVSGSLYGYNPQATFIITNAFRKLAVINENEQPSAGMFEDAFQALNSLIKEWEALGIHVWTEEEAVLFLQPNQVRYLVGDSSTDKSADAFSYVTANLASNAATGTHTLSMVSATGILNGQNIGVVLDSGSTQWTTVNGAPSGNTVTITAALASSASAGAFVFTYASGGEIARPLKVPSARRLAFQGTLEIPMLQFSRKEYMDLPNKTNPGIPTAFFYTPKREQGEIYVWPAPNNSSSGLRITWYRPIEDFLTVANTMDMPVEWVNALTWNLAVELAPDFSVPIPRFQLLKLQAAEKLDLVRGWDREAEPIYFTMDFDQTRM